MKNIQLCFTPQAFRAERDAWRIVIHLNVCRAVAALLAALGADDPAAPDRRAPGASPGPGPGPADELRRLRMRLSPLRDITYTFEARPAGAGATARPGTSSAARA